MRPVALLLLGLAGCAGSGTAERTRWSVLEESPQRPAAGTYREGLRLRCDPADATVQIDGVPKGVCEDFGRTPVQVRGEGRLHLLEVKKEGFAPYQSYYAPSGALVTVTVKLQPLAVSVSERTTP